MPTNPTNLHESARARPDFVGSAAEHEAFFRRQACDERFMLSGALLIAGRARADANALRADSVRPAMSRAPGVRAAGGALARQDRRPYARQPRRRRGGRNPFVWIRAIRGLIPEDYGRR